MHYDCSTTVLAQHNDESRLLRVAPLERWSAPPLLRELVDGDGGNNGDGDGGSGNGGNGGTTKMRKPGLRAYTLSPASLLCLGPEASSH